MVTSVFELNGSIPSATGFMFSVQQVATPTFSPAAGTYTSTQSVTITCSTPSSTIYYTTNGSTPTTSSAVYSTPISVAATETLKAIATATAYTQSTAGSAAYTIESTAATPVFLFSSFNSGDSSVISLPGDAGQFTGTVMQICGATGTEHEAGAGWYRTQVNIASGFTCNFTFVMTPSGSIPFISGMTFCVQASTTATNPNFEGAGPGIGAYADANSCGYGALTYNTYQGIGNSIAVKFDVGANSGNQLSWPVGGTPNTTGLYINGGPYASLIPDDDLNPYGVNLNTSDVMACTVVYDNSLQLITWVITDTVTGGQARFMKPVNLPACLGGNLAWVGFTAGQAGTGSASSPINIQSWSFSTGFNTRLASPVLSPAPGTYSSSQTVTISYPAGSTCYYTTNGLMPTSASTLYTGPIAVSANEIINAVAIQTGYTDSYVGGGIYTIGAGPIINYPSGFAANDGVIISGYAVYSGSQIHLTDRTYNPIGNEISSVWFGAPVNITTFSSTFSYTSSGLDNTGNGNCGFTFCIQNYTPASSNTSGSQASANSWVSGGNVVKGNTQGGLGYSGNTGSGGQQAGILQSVALAFDLTVGSDGAVGVYTNGAEPVGSSTNLTMNINSGNPITIALTYSGSSLGVTLTDSVTNATQTLNFTVNIPAIVGGSTAFVGFTAATGYSVANQYLNSWTVT